MSAAICHRPVSFEVLLDYWLGDLDDAATLRIDEHLLGCDACGAQLDEIVALGDGVRRAFLAGLFGTVVGADFVHRLAQRGLRVREYTVARNGSINCSLDPDDDVLVSRLSAPLSGIGRLDLLVAGIPGMPERRAEDVPFDPDAAEVVFVAPAGHIRGLPPHVGHMRLLAVDASGEHVLGDYTFHHGFGG
jgi:hypothetical protein